MNTADFRRRISPWLMTFAAMAPLTTAGIVAGGCGSASVESTDLDGEGGGAGGLDLPDHIGGSGEGGGAGEGGADTTGAGASSSSSSSSSSSGELAGVGCNAKDTSSVTVDLTTGMHMSLSVDGGPEVSPLFDTGSVGLRIGEWNLPSKDHCKLDAKGSVVNAITYGYYDGVQYVGCKKTGDVTVGGVVFPDADFMAIHEVRCSASKPSCKASQCEPGGKGPASVCHTAGTLGAGLGLDSKAKIPSPFGYHPGNLGNGLIVRTGGASKNGWPVAPEVTFGLTAENRKGFHMYSLDGSGTLPNGKPRWSLNTIPICMRIGGVSLDGCSKPEADSSPHNLALPDTGFTSPTTWVDDATYKKIKPFLSGDTLKQGTNVKVVLPSDDGNDLTWSFSADTKKLPLEVHVENVGNGGENNKTNIGLGSFLSFDVLLDPCAGKIGFRPSGG